MGRAGRALAPEATRGSTAQRRGPAVASHPARGHPDAERRMYRAAEGQLCPGHQQLPPPIPGISRALWPLHLLPVSQPHLQTAWPPACPYSHQWLGAPTKSPLGAATPEVSYKLGCLCIAHNTGPPWLVSGAPMGPTPKHAHPHQPQGVISGPLAQGTCHCLAHVLPPS